MRRQKQTRQDRFVKHIEQDLPTRREICDAEVDDERKNGNQPRRETRDQQKTARTLREAGDIHVESRETVRPIPESAAPSLVRRISATGRETNICQPQ